VPAVAPETGVNRFIQALPRGERLRLLAGCETVDLDFADVLCQPGEASSHVYFPLTSCISLVASVDGHPPLEMDLIGSEGMLGLSEGLGVAQDVPLMALVKCPGSALRMSASRFRKELRNGPALLRALKRHLHLLLAQLARTAACTGFHDVEARLARWLLMIHDRAKGDHFHLTHEHLADMLGVQRSAVTIAAGTMQKAQLISYSRGEIQMLDRDGLEAMSCECYQASVDDSANSHAGNGKGNGRSRNART